MLEPLRNRLVEAEVVLRGTYNLDDTDIYWLNTTRRVGTLTWMQLSGAGKTAVTNYLAGLHALATAEKQEIENLKGSKA